MSTVSVPFEVPSLTVRVKVSVASVVTSGAVNEGVCVVAPVNVTVGVPAVWLHEYVRLCPSGSVPLPERDTEVPSATVWFTPALAVGASFSARMVMSTVSVFVKLPSLTVRVNVSVASAIRFGAVNEGVCVVAPVNVTVGVPPVCVHE